MKKIITISFILLGLTTILIYGQVADGITYQAVALDENGREIAGRDISGNIIYSKQISVRFSILEGTDNGSVLYKEEHTTNTDQFGLFSLVIGHGTVSSEGIYQMLTDIPWGADKLFLKVEIDTKRSGNYKLMGIQQMMAVPFAFHALTSSSTTVNYNDILNRPVLAPVAISGDYIDLINRPTVFSGNYIDLINKPVIPTKLSELTNDVGFITNPNDADSDPTNEIQTLSLEGNSLSISQGNSVNLPTSDNGTPSTDYSFRTISFPQGIDYPIEYKYETTQTEFTVPEAKTLYILHGDNLQILYDGTFRQLLATVNLPNELACPIVKENSVIRFRGDLTYFLADYDPNIEPVGFFVEGNTNTTYTVPLGKRLIMTSFSDYQDIRINSWTYDPQYNITKYSLIIPPESVVTSVDVGVYITGYLMDNNSTGTSSNTVTDADNNVYSTVQIGSQLWMGENLRTTKFNDGNPIPLVTDNNSWGSLTSSAYCWYNNDPSNKSPYGGLYNGYAVNTAKLCPVGWHVPTDVEWATLIYSLGGGGIAGGKLKETGTTHWFTPNTGATNETNFTALPGGFRYSGSGTFNSLGEMGFLWTSTLAKDLFFYRYSMSYSDAHIEQSNYDFPFGFSVRCIKN